MRHPKFVHGAFALLLRYNKKGSMNFFHLLSREWFNLPGGNNHRIRNVHIDHRRIQEGRNRQTFFPCHFRCSCHDFLSPYSSCPFRWRDKMHHASNLMMDNFRKTRRKNQKDTNMTFHLSSEYTNLHFGNDPRKQSHVFHIVHLSSLACNYISKVADLTL